MSPGPRLAHQGDDQPLLRDLCASGLCAPDGEGVSRRRAALSIAPAQSRDDGFRPLTASTALRTLHNPRYAGAYAYGRRRYRRMPDGKKVLRKRECTDWLACIPNAHPGYITWEQYQGNLKLLEANGRGYEVARVVAAPRGGGAVAGARRMRALWTTLARAVRSAARTARGLVRL